MNLTISFLQPACQFMQLLFAFRCPRPVNSTPRPARFRVGLQSTLYLKHLHEVKKSFFIGQYLHEVKKSVVLSGNFFLTMYTILFVDPLKMDSYSFKDLRCVLSLFEYDVSGLLRE